VTAAPRIGVTLAAAAALSAALAGCGRGTHSPAVGSPPAQLDGRRLIVYYGCGACHVIGGIGGADGHVGPSLRGFSGLRMIAGKLPNTPENAARWIHDPQKIVPGVDMPVLGIGMNGARAIAAYL
jgi:cytochrome c